MIVSAGVVCYRQGPHGLEILIVHPSGAYNRRAPWSIPKGLPEPGESLADAARRETFEETGVLVQALRPLGSIEYQKSRKRVTAFAADCAQQVPRCASWEVDAVEFVPVEMARARLHPDQWTLIDRLLAALQPGVPPET